MNTFQVSKLRLALALLASSQLIACSAFDLDMKQDAAWSERWASQTAADSDEHGVRDFDRPGSGFTLMLDGYALSNSQVAGSVQDAGSTLRQASYQIPVDSQAVLRRGQEQTSPLQPVGAYSGQRIHSHQGWQFDTSDQYQRAPKAVEAKSASVSKVREMPKRPQMALAKVSLDLDREQGYCQAQKLNFGKGLSAKYHELMALYMSQAEVLSQSEMESRTKYQLMSDVSLKFLDSQTKARGLEYLNDTLYGLCRLHALGVMEEAKYQQNVNALLDGTARQLMIDLRKLRLDGNDHAKQGLREVSRY